MDADIRTQRRFYRRGLVLGFTMAEIVVLILFALLLALAAILKHKDEQITDLRQTTTAKEVQLVELTDKLNRLLSAVGEVNQFDDLFRELRLAKQEAAKAHQLEQRVAALEEQTRTMERITAQLITAEMAGASVEVKVAWLSERVWLADQVAKVIREVGLPADTPQATFAEIEKLSHVVPRIREALAKSGYKDSEVREFMDKTVAQLHEAEARIPTLQGQLRNAQRTLEGAGKGTEHPACWASPETGKPEYIFDVALTSTGIIVRDNALPHRAEAQRHLPLQMVVFGEELSLERFLATTLPLSEWSNAQGCRFFVRVFDLTKVDEKDIYKHHLRTVAQRFYHYDDLSAKF